MATQNSTQATDKSKAPTGNAKNISTPSATPAFFNAQLQPPDSLPAKRWHQEMTINRHIQIQKNPYADPTQISKGNTVTTAGGSFALYDSTGGTALFSYDPSTGVITINGSLVSNVVNSGTYQNVTLSGSNTVSGTQFGGNYSNPNISGGTVNAQEFLVSKNAGQTGNIVYVKSVNFAGSTTNLGTIFFQGGIITAFS